MTLTEFLLARIAEDEHWWRVVEERESSADVPTTNWLGLPLTARMLVDCEAKRRIVNTAPLKLLAGGEERQADRLRNQTLRLLAVSYADHPDYRQEWTP